MALRISRVAILAIVLMATCVLAADWDSCQDDLDTLRRRTSDASDQASEVRDAYEELQQKRQEVEECRSYPRIYDLLRYGCSSQPSAANRWEFLSTDARSLAVCNVY